MFKDKFSVSPSSLRKASKKQKVETMPITNGIIQWRAVCYNTGNTFLMKIEYEVKKTVVPIITHYWSVLQKGQRNLTKNTQQKLFWFPNFGDWIFMLDPQAFYAVAEFLDFRFIWNLRFLKIIHAGSSM